MYYYPLLTNFLNHFLSMLDAKGHFSCFLKKVLFIGGDQKKVVFSLFFFNKKNPKIYSFSPMIQFWVVFWTKKNDTFDESGQNKSQNEKF